MRRFINIETVVSALFVLYSVVVLLKDLGVVQFEEPLDFPIVIIFYLVFIDYFQSKKKKEVQV